MIDFIDLLYGDVLRIKNIENLRIINISLNSYFTVIELNDGSFGSAINYLTTGVDKKRYNVKKIEDFFLKCIKKDPLLINTLKNKKNLLYLSLRIAILSALSQEFFDVKEMKKEKIYLKKINYSVEDYDYKKLKKNILKNVNSILIVGDGGSYPSILEENVKEIYVIDKLFKNKYNLGRAIMDYKNLSKEDKKVRFLINIPKNKRFDCLWITGSVLCNDTLKDFYPLIKQAKRSVLQGPSCSIYPKKLFDIGITDILTTIKDKKEMEYSLKDKKEILKVVDDNYIYMRKN